jgi:hypothetical protein
MRDWESPSRPNYVLTCVKTDVSLGVEMPKVMKFLRSRFVWLKIRRTGYRSIDMPRGIAGRQHDVQSERPVEAHAGAAAAPSGNTKKNSNDVLVRNPAPDSSPPASPSGQSGSATILC